MSALSFSLMGESPTFSGLQFWLQGCAAFPHLLQEAPPRILLNTCFSAGCVQAPPPPGSHPPLGSAGSAVLPPPPQYLACAAAQHLSGWKRAVRAPTGPFRSHRSPRACINDSVPFGARHGTGANTDAGTKRAENTMGMEVGKQAGPTGQSSEGHFRGRRPFRGGPQNGTGRPGG